MPVATTWTQPVSRTGYSTSRRSSATSTRRRACSSRPVSRRCTPPVRSRPISHWKRRASIRSTSSCCGRDFPPTRPTQTIFTILKANWYYLEQNKYVQWAPGQTFDVVVPGQHETALALPWGGTCHPVWFKNDPRVSNVKAAGGVFDRTVMEGVVATQKIVEEQIKTLPADEQEAALAEIAGSVQAGMPPRENPRINTSLDSVYASGPLGRSHVVIHGNCNYKQTGLLHAYAAHSLLQQAPKRTGLASACQAFGHRELLGALRSFGLALEPEVTINA